MSDRKRINISVDPKTYERLKRVTEMYNFKNPCELMVSFAHILLDRIEPASERLYDMPDEDGEYIDSMFDDLGNIERVPDGTVPVRHNNRRLE